MCLNEQHLFGFFSKESLALVETTGREVSAEE
jgi:hypothetical protein